MQTQSKRANNSNKNNQRQYPLQSTGKKNNYKGIK